MTADQHQLRPLPTPQPESRFYWEKAREHELWLKQCRACKQAYFYPRDICPLCFSRKTEWLRASGRAILYAFSIAHRGPTLVFQELVPYVAAIVELEEGARMATNLVKVDPSPEHIRIGMAVHVVFEDISDDITLPMFAPD